MSCAESQTISLPVSAIATIIIPTWNSARFIERTIQSLLSQPAAEHLSVLCVDDGSKDETVSICRELERQDHRIHLIARGHHGVSPTRNAGILAATTPYIGFLDSDDCWEEGFFDQSVLKMLDGQTDMIGFGWQAVGQDRIPVRRFESTNALICGGYQAVRAGERHFACYFYQRSFLLKHGLLFHPEVQFNEDEVFRTMCLYRAKQVRLHEKRIFSNLLRTDSLRHQRFPGMGVNHLFKVWEYAWSYFYENTPEDKQILHYCLEKVNKYIPKMRELGEMSPQTEMRYAGMCQLSGEEEEA